MYAFAFGPWAERIDLYERVARLRALRALANVLAHNQTEFRAALAIAENGDDDVLAVALELFEQIPALPRRKLLASSSVLDRDTPSVNQTINALRAIASEM